MAGALIRVASGVLPDHPSLELVDAHGIVARELGEYHVEVVEDHLSYGLDINLRQHEPMMLQGPDKGADSSCDRSCKGIADTFRQEALQSQLCHER